MEIAERLYRFFGETDAAVINRDCMQEFFDWMKTPAARKDHKDMGLSAKTINNTYVVLSEFFEDNIGKYFISNPCRKTKRDKAIVSEARVLEQDEQEERRTQQRHQNSGKLLKNGAWAERFLLFCLLGFVWGRYWRLR